MTTSGVSTNNPLRDEIIRAALRKVGAYASLAGPRPDQIEDAAKALNMMVKAWQVQGFMWARQFVTLFLQPGQAVYSLPGDHGASEYRSTTLTAGAEATAISLSVASTTGVSLGDMIGVVLASGSLHWSTVSMLDPGVALGLTDALPSAASSGAAVYVHTEANGLYRPTRIFNAQRKNADGYEISLTSMSRDDYAQQVNKDQAGTPTQFYYDAQLATGKLYLWQPPQTASERLVLDMDRPLQVMLDAEDTSDFPQEWIECLVYGLAVRIAPEYALPLAERRELKGEFFGMANNLLDANSDWTSTFLGVDNHG